MKRIITFFMLLSLIWSFKAYANSSASVSDNAETICLRLEGNLLIPPYRLNHSEVGQWMEVPVHNIDVYDKNWQHIERSGHNHPNEFRLEMDKEYMAKGIAEANGVHFPGVEHFFVESDWQGNECMYRHLLMEIENRNQNTIRAIDRNTNQAIVGVEVTFSSDLIPENPTALTNARGEILISELTEPIQLRARCSGIPEGYNLVGESVKDVYMHNFETVFYFEKQVQTGCVTLNPHMHMLPYEVNNNLVDIPIGFSPSDIKIFNDHGMEIEFQQDDLDPHKIRIENIEKGKSYLITAQQPFYAENMFYVDPNIRDCEDIYIDLPIKSENKLKIRAVNQETGQTINNVGFNIFVEVFWSRFDFNARTEGEGVVNIYRILEDTRFSINCTSIPEDYTLISEPTLELIYEPYWENEGVVFYFKKTSQITCVTLRPEAHLEPLLINHNRHEGWHFHLQPHPEELAILNENWQEVEIDRENSNPNEIRINNVEKGKRYWIEYRGPVKAYGEFHVDSGSADCQDIQVDMRIEQIGRLTVQAIDQASYESVHNVGFNFIIRSHLIGQELNIDAFNEFDGSVLIDNVAGMSEFIITCTQIPEGYSLIGEPHQIFTMHEWELEKEIVFNFSRNSSEFGINLYNNSLVIDSDTSVQEVVIYDSMGSVILKDKSGKKNIDISNLRNETYLIKVQTDNKVHSQKVIKK